LRVIDDHDIGENTYDPHHNPVTSADDAPSEMITSFPIKNFLEFLVLWVEVNAGVSIHSDVIPDAHIAAG
jgi:hypothetical protein